MHCLNAHDSGYWLLNILQETRACDELTILHQLGLDPNGLNYFYAGLHQKLVGVEGAEPIRQLI